MVGYRDWFIKIPKYLYSLTSGIFSSFAIENVFPFLLRIRKYPDFFSFIFMLLFIHQFFITDIDLWSCSIEVQTHHMSSAYALTSILFSSKSNSKSLMKKLNRIGDRTDHCINPLLVLIISFPIISLNLLSMYLIKLTVLHGTPRDSPVSFKY